MATIWRECDGEYISLHLPGKGDQATTVDVPGSVVVSHDDGNRTGHALITRTGAAASANGQEIIGGLHVLQHKDELLIDGQRIHYSAESAPVVEVYTHDSTRRRPRCPVCRAEIQDGESIVRCPGCTRIYHLSPATDENPEKPCWTYSPTCRFCPHPTSMSGEASWRPDQEDQ